MDNIRADDKLGLGSKMMDFDVHLLRWANYNCSISSDHPQDCDYREPINYSQDIYMCFVSVLLRVIFNSCYDYFLNFPLKLADETFMIRKIGKFAQNICYVFWHTNINYFFEVFDKFNDLNRSICYEVNKHKQEKGPYTYPKATLEIFFM